MALRVRLTPGAIQDLEDIRAYLIPRSQQGADNVRRDIESTIQTLSEFPGIGRVTDISDVRVIAAARYPYLIYHRISDAELTVVHVRDGRRDAPAPGEI